MKLLIGSAAVVFGTAGFVATGSAAPESAAATIAIATTSNPASDSVASSTAPIVGAFAAKAKTALAVLSSAVRPLSNPHALEDAVHSYFAFKAAHPDEVKKPYFYFVDFGLPNTEPRGYLFDMSALRVVEGPFTVAQGRGSAPARASIPTRFSNAFGSMATSLGLYVAKATYAFTGTSGGRHYHSIGMQLDGVSDGFNDNALARRVVVHGAPYVTPSRAGSSEGCPAMELSRAQRLLPKLANGGLVFLFAPNAKWMAGDEWVSAGVS